MKNYLTITTILAAGTLALNAATTVVFDFGRTDNESYKTPDAICIGKDGTAYEDLLTATGELRAMTGSYSFTQEASGWPYNNSATLTPQEEEGWKNHMTSVPTGWENTFLDGLTSQWTGSTGNKFTLSFTGLASGYYNLSALGGYYGKDNLMPSVELALSGEGLDCTKTTMSATSINDGATFTSSAQTSLAATLTKGATSNNGYTFDVKNIFVGKSGALTITITGTGSENNRTPLNGIKLTQVPEPSMFGLLAGLGALALVGARRRRK